MVSSAATSGMAVAFLAFSALPGFALRGFFAFAFFAGARLAFFTLCLARPRYICRPRCGLGRGGRPSTLRIQKSP